MELRKILNWVEFIASAKNSNKYCTCCIDIGHCCLVSDWVFSIFLVQLINFDQTTGFYRSYMLLFNLPILDLHLTPTTVAFPL